MKKTNIPKQKVCLVAVDLGYGHQRAAMPLRHLDHKGQMTLANNYPNIPAKDLRTWSQGRRPYEVISRSKRIPILGDILFWGMDQIQRIKSFYPRRSLLKQSLQLKVNVSMIRKHKWGKDLIDKLDKFNLPLLTTFFTIAYMAEEFSYKQDIYLVVCDADVSRAWASPNPMKSKIKYLAPNKRVYERLQLYGVNPDKIYFTGFPLPLVNLGDEKLSILKKDLGKRLRNLDPQNRYISKYRRTITEHLGKNAVPQKSTHPLTVTFAVGGAGAQRELGIGIVKSLKKQIEKDEVRVILVAGIRLEVKEYFEVEVRKLRLGKQLGKNIQILYEGKRENYFKNFNKILRTTDILWTKPSELSFYCALGLPIIINEPLGFQEKFNRKWLKNIGAGLDGENIKYTDEWLFDWLKSGWLAEAAMQGFFEAPKYGTFNIEKIVCRHLEDVKEPDTVLQY
ncbi:MAG: hypothetical protein ABIJ91_01130 [Candidatus Kuenenbacteria bacterium]